MANLLASSVVEKVTVAVYGAGGQTCYTTIQPGVTQFAWLSAFASRAGYYALTAAAPAVVRAKLSKLVFSKVCRADRRRKI